MNFWNHSATEKQWACFEWVYVSRIRARGQAGFREGRSTLDYILTWCTSVDSHILTWSIFVVLISKSFWHGSGWQALGAPPTLWCITSFASCESHVNQSAKVRSNGDIHDKVIGCPFLLHYLACTLTWMLWLFSSGCCSPLCRNCVLLSKSGISTQQVIWVLHFQLMSIYLIPKSWSLAETKGYWSKQHLMQVRIKLR